MSVESILYLSNGGSDSARSLVCPSHRKATARFKGRPQMEERSGGYGQYDARQLREGVKGARGLRAMRRRHVVGAGRPLVEGSKDDFNNGARDQVRK